MKDIARLRRDWQRRTHKLKERICKFFLSGLFACHKENAQLKEQLVLAEAMLTATLSERQTLIAYHLTDHSASRHEIRTLQSTVARNNEDIALWKERAIRDDLTLLLTRRAVKEMFHAKTEILRRKGLSVEISSVLVIDVDDLKPINSIYGEPIGDRAIVAVAEVIKRCFRDSDVLGRWGGDEFVVIAPGMSLEKITDRLERLKQELAQIRIQDKEGHLIEQVFTASIGVTYLMNPSRSFKQLDDQVEEMIGNADIALREAKKQGKNRVVFI